MNRVVPLDEGADRRPVVLTGDEVFLPMPRYCTVGDLGWAFGDADHVLDPAAALSRSQSASLDALDRRAKASASAGAVLARYPRRPSPSRRRSRLIVDGDRPRRRAISRTQTGRPPHRDLLPLGEGQVPIRGLENDRWDHPTSLMEPTTRGRVRHADRSCSLGHQGPRPNQPPEPPTSLHRDRWTTSDHAPHTPLLGRGAAATPSPRPLKGPELASGLRP